MAMGEVPIRVLLVEDEPDVRYVAEAILCSFGYTVTAVANGAEALGVMGEAQPDLILSDIRMPVLDGFQLLQRIRADPVWSQTPFIILSAKAESADLRMGMSLGADDYVTKPYKPHDIRKTIEIRVQRARQVSEAIANNQRFLTRILPHELRTPLMGVIGYADLMVDAANDGKTLSVAELSEYGRMLQLSGARIFRIVESLLFWARLDAPRSAQSGPGKQKRVHEEVSAAGLGELAARVATQFGRQRDLVVDCPVLAKIQVVTAGFEFVARHLIENAFKCSLPGSLVRLTARTDAQMLHMTVSDSGRGMTREQIDGINGIRGIERFEFEGQGLGVGLMLATTFARLSGGSLKIRPAAGENGLEVSVSLPLAPQTEAG
jgi:two-component system sensor histidine kinase/response regulator